MAQPPPLLLFLLVDIYFIPSNSSIFSISNLCFGSSCFSQISDKNEQSIFLSGLTVNKNNAKLYNNHGHALESKNKYEEALTLFKEAAKVQPNDIGAHINIGRTLNFLENGQFCLSNSLMKSGPICYMEDLPISSAMAWP